LCEASERFDVRKRIGIIDAVQRPGISDAVCLGLLLMGSLAGAVFEPSNRDFFVEIPLLFELPLLCTSLLLVLSRSNVATGIAAVIHVAILAESALFLALSAFLLVTILFAATAVIIGPVSVILAFNSVYTLGLIAARSRVVSTQVSTS
jgi:hypothetical protein